MEARDFSPAMNKYTTIGDISKPNDRFSYFAGHLEYFSQNGFRTFISAILRKSAAFAEFKGPCAGFPRRGTMYSVGRRPIKTPKGSET